MDGTYDVYLGRDPIGKVCVRQKGLYFCFSCRCKLSGEVMYKLTAIADDHQESIGLLVPMDGDFGLEKQVSIKKLGDGPFSFRLVPKHSAYRGEFIPLFPEEPFAYIARLKNAYLEKRGTQTGIVLESR